MKRSSLLLLVLLGTFSRQVIAAPNPLAPLARLQATLTKGMDAVLKGQGEKAFAPLAAKMEKPLGPELKLAGVVSAKLLAMELELVYYAGATPVYYLRSAVAATGHGPAFVEIRGREVKGGLHVTARPLADYKGVAAPLAAAAQALAKVLAAKECSSRLPIAAPADFDFLPPKVADRAGRDLEKTRGALPQLCTQVSALKPTKIDLRIDDVGFAAMNKEGKMVGLIRAGLELDGGKLTVKYGKFRPNPDR